MGLGAILSGLGAALSGVASAGQAVGSVGASKRAKKNTLAVMKQQQYYNQQNMQAQYNYMQQAADSEYDRNLAMWKATNAPAQRKMLEDANLSVGLMYGNGGLQQASSAGGHQGAAPQALGNPVEMAIQERSNELQEQSIRSTNILNLSQAAKNMAETDKIGGYEKENTKADTDKIKAETAGQILENKLTEVKTLIANHNVKEAKANADKAIEEWNQAVLKTDMDAATFQLNINKLYNDVTNTYKQGILLDEQIDLTKEQKEYVGKEIQYYTYSLYTERMKAAAAMTSANAAAKNADTQEEAAKNLKKFQEDTIATKKREIDVAIDKIEKDFKMRGQELDMRHKELIKDYITCAMDNATKIVTTYMQGQTKIK